MKIWKSSKLLSTLLIFIAPQMALAVLPVSLFFKKHTASLVFSTSAQTIYASNCSNAVTLQNKNWLNANVNVTSNVTINLLATGSVVFYTDSSCTLSTNSVVMSSGTSTATVYFISSTTGTPTLTASASTYTNVSQTQTVSTNPFVWTGGGGNTNWNTGLNWPGGVAPSGSDMALFNETCISNCSPTINVSISVLGVRLDTGYSGTITQAAAQTITLGASGGWVQLNGTFSGSAAAITNGGNFVLVGGTFTSTSGNYNMGGSRWSITGTGVYASNSGQIIFNPPSPGRTVSIVPGTGHYYALMFAGINVVYDLGGNTLYVDGLLNFNTSLGAHTTGFINSGTLIATGDITATAHGCGGSAIVQVAGNIAGQTISSDTSSAEFPGINIAAGANTVTLGTYVTIPTSLTVTSVGTFNTSNSNILFNGGNTNISTGSKHLNNVTFAVCFANITGTLHVDGTLTLAWACGGNDKINGGTINAYGNIYSVGSGGYSGSTTLNISGATGQSMNGNGYTPASTTVAKTGGSVLTLASAATMNNLTLTSGSIDMTGFDLTINSSFVSLNGNTINKNSGVLKVNGVVIGTGALYGGTIN